MIAKKDNPKLWDEIKKDLLKKNNNKWNARLAQQAVKIYKSKGGGYLDNNKNQTSLKKWTDEEWGYIEEGSKRYLPKKIRDELSTKQKKKFSKGKKLGTIKEYPKELNKIMKKFKIY